MYAPPPRFAFARAPPRRSAPAANPPPPADAGASPSSSPGSFVFVRSSNAEAYRFTRAGSSNARFLLAWYPHWLRSVVGTISPPGAPTRVAAPRSSNPRHRPKNASAASAPRYRRHPRATHAARFQTFFAAQVGACAGRAAAASAAPAPGRASAGSVMAGAPATSSSACRPTLSAETGSISLARTTHRSAISGVDSEYRNSYEAKSLRAEAGEEAAWEEEARCARSPRSDARSDARSARRPDATATAAAPKGTSFATAAVRRSASTEMVSPATTSGDARPDCAAASATHARASACAMASASGSVSVEVSKCIVRTTTGRGSGTPIEARRGDAPRKRRRRPQTPNARTPRDADAPRGVRVERDDDRRPRQLSRGSRGLRCICTRRRLATDDVSTLAPNFLREKQMRTHSRDTLHSSLK